jgi:hypothetical protein
VGPRAVLEAVVKRKIPSPRRESKPRIPTLTTENNVVWKTCGLNKIVVWNGISETNAKFAAFTALVIVLG